MGKFKLGVAGKFDDNRRAEDLISIADLAGGAIAESLSSLGPESIPLSTNIFSYFHKHLSTKSQLIHAWLSLSNVPLKKLLCVVRPGDARGLLFSFGTPYCGFSQAITSLKMWLPPDKGWAKSATSWELRR
jgi:hypothetical protein